MSSFSTQPLNNFSSSVWCLIEDFEGEMKSESMEGDVEEDYSAFSPKPVGRRTFWAVMKARKCRYTFKSHPHECTLHDQGPVWEVWLAEDKAKLARAETEKQEIVGQLASRKKKLEENIDAVDDLSEPIEVLQQKLAVAELLVLELGARFRFCCLLSRAAAQCKLIFIIVTVSSMQACSVLVCCFFSLYHQIFWFVNRYREKEVRRYHIHLEQFETARAKIKEIEANLKVGECVVYRDFVNQYTPNGKCINLILVALWRELVDDPELNVLKFNHFCTDKDSNGASSFFVASVMRYHFETAGTGFFSKFHTLYVSGDHGSHFRSRQTVYHESTFWDLYKKVSWNFFLCSYHAYNRCDGAGVESIRLSKEWELLGQAIELAEVFADVLNSSRFNNSIGIPFAKINRSVNVFPRLNQVRLSFFVD